VRFNNKNKCSEREKGAKTNGEGDSCCYAMMVSDMIKNAMQTDA
jgi:hypothetical protein